MDLSGVDVEDLVERLDLKNARLTSSGTEVNFSCFGGEHSHGDESPSAYINVETTAYFCHGCKRRGNAVKLVMEVHQVARPTAERTLREWYGIDFLEPIGGSMVAEVDMRFAPIIEQPSPPKPSPSWPISARVDWHNPDGEPMDYMFARGFDPTTLTEWDIGYAYHSDRITIPVFDVGGELVGIKGRAWRPEHQPKYLILGDSVNMTTYGFAPYLAAEVVFGLHCNRDCKTVVLCEGELNAIALHQIGVPRPIATGMSYFTERHAQLVIREADEVVVYYDHGDAGYKGAWGTIGADGRRRLGAVQMLEDHVQVRVVNSLPEDPSKLVELGRGQEALQLIEDASSSLALQVLLG